MFEDLGISRIDADILTHEIILPDRTVWSKIVAAFGEEILQNDRSIDRQKLAGIIFKDPKDRKRLEAIIHPKVLEEMNKKIELFREKGLNRVLLEIPLLFEAGWDKEGPFAAIIVVKTDQATQIKRAMQKFNLGEEDVLARIHAQMPLPEKINRADFVIDNNGDLAKTREQVEAIYKKIIS